MKPVYQPSTEELIAFLSDPASFGGGGNKQVEIRQTHTSIVALVGNLVFKVKKAVRLPFLDFSNLEQRLHYMQEELRLNRRLTDNMYLRVVPIYREEGKLSFTNRGDAPVEYALIMLRLSAKGMLKNQVMDPHFDPTLLDQYASRLAAFYRSYPTSPQITAYGSPQKISTLTAANLRELRDAGTGLLPVQAMEIICRYQETFVEQHFDWFARRAKEEKIKDCHGDLHLDHVHLERGKLNIFDCIEFQESFRYIDQLYDWAFSAMDLDACERHDLSQRFIRYLTEKTEQEDVSDLLHFYLCYRATIVAKSYCLRAKEKEISPGEQAEAILEARKYCGLALQYALFGPRRSLVVVFGGVGAGKADISSILASTLATKRFTSDQVRKELAGLQQAAPSQDTLYSDEVNIRTYNTLFERAFEAVNARGSAIIEATYANPNRLQRLKASADATGIQLILIQATASEETVKARLAERAGQQDDISRFQLQEYQRLREQFESFDIGSISPYLTVDTELAREPLTQSLFEQLWKFLR